MDIAHDDAFVVFVRLDRAHTHPPEAVEQPIHYCGSYEEARRICKECHDPAYDYVIRYMGTTGGGD